MGVLLKNPLAWTLLVLALAATALWQAEQRTLAAEHEALAASLVHYPQQTAVLPLQRTLEITLSDGTQHCGSLLWVAEHWFDIRRRDGSTEARPGRGTRHLHGQLARVLREQPQCRTLLFTLHGRYTPQSQRVLLQLPALEP